MGIKHHFAFTDKLRFGRAKQSPRATAFQCASQAICQSHLRSFSYIASQVCIFPICVCHAGLPCFRTGTLAEFLFYYLPSYTAALWALPQHRTACVGISDVVLAE